MNEVATQHYDGNASVQGVHRQRHLKRRIRRIADEEDEDLLGAQGKCAGATCWVCHMPCEYVQHPQRMRVL